MNTVNEGAEVTLGGRLFHARVTITQNERSPVVRSCVRGKYKTKNLRLFIRLNRGSL